MEETIALINQLIEEHKQILQEFQTMEQVAKRCKRNNATG